MPIPLIGWAAAAVGAVVVGAVVNAFSDDDKSSTTTTSNRNELEEEKKKKELSHNEKIYASIKEYKKGVLDSIKRDFGVEIRYHNDKGGIYALGLAMSGLLIAPIMAIFSKNLTNSDEIVFHGIDTSHIEKENENLQNEINELKEFLDEIKNG